MRPNGIIAIRIIMTVSQSCDLSDDPYGSLRRNDETVSAFRDVHKTCVMAHGAVVHAVQQHQAAWGGEGQGEARPCAIHANSILISNLSNLR